VLDSPPPFFLSESPSISSRPLPVNELCGPRAGAERAVQNFEAQISGGIAPPTSNPYLAGLFASLYSRESLSPPLYSQPCPLLRPLLRRRSSLPAPQKSAEEAAPFRHRNRLADPSPPSGESHKQTEKSSLAFWRFFLSAMH